MVRVLHGHSITMERTVRGLTTCVKPTLIRRSIVKNKRGYTGTVTLGIEEVNFRFGGMRGIFLHDRNRVLSVSTNYTTRNDMLELPLNTQACTLTHMDV